MTMADTWQINKGLAETNLHMLDNLILCDVTFLLGERRQEMKAHKFMLVSRSPVFYTMFCGPVAESRDLIEIPDIDKDSFSLLLRFNYEPCVVSGNHMSDGKKRTTVAHACRKKRQLEIEFAETLQFCRYLYTTECDITGDSVMSLLYAGKKYQVEDLVVKCNTYLESEMSTDNVCVILQQSYMFDEQVLTQRCLEYILKNGQTVLQSSGFVSLKKEVLPSIIKSDNLRASEVTVYKACVHWAEEECKRTKKELNDEIFREVLGVDLIKQIRFPCMTHDEFVTHVACGSILLAEEKVDVFIHMTKKTKTIFNCKPRQRNSKTVRIERFITQYSNWNLRHSCPDAIKFECSTSCSFIGVCLYAPCKSGEIKGQLEVLDNTENVMFSTNVAILYKEGIDRNEIMFDQPVHIQENTTYTLTQKHSGSFVYYGRKGRTSVNDEGFEVRFSESTLVNSSDTNVDKGQLPVLIFELEN